MEDKANEDYNRTLRDMQKQSHEETMVRDIAVYALLITGMIGIAISSRKKKEPSNLDRR
jgi:hypothetical protein